MTIAGPDLDPFILFRIVEVLHSAYTAGHIKITDHISFFITLLSRLKVFPGTFGRIYSLATSFLFSILRQRLAPYSQVQLSFVCINLMLLFLFISRLK